MNKYRPSEKEIEAVAQILKDWEMPSGWTTAAVLALDAAGKIRAPKKMEKREDSQMLNFIEGVVGIIEASSNEKMYIWQSNKDHRKETWEDRHSGILEYVGWLNKRPICISLQIVIIGGNKILFWHATSSLVDYEMIDEWFELNLPGIPKTDATNWTNVLPRKES